MNNNNRYNDNNYCTQLIHDTEISNIIYKDETPTIFTTIDKYPHGLLNPIEKKYDTKTINIDTEFRDNYSTTSATNFVYKFPDPLVNVTSMYKNTTGQLLF